MQTMFILEYRHAGKDYRSAHYTLAEAQHEALLRRCQIDSKFVIREIPVISHIDALRAEVEATVQ